MKTFDIHNFTSYTGDTIKKGKYMKMKNTETGGSAK